MPAKKKTVKPKAAKKKVAKKKTVKKRIVSSKARVGSGIPDRDIEFSQANTHSGGGAFLDEAQRAVNGEPLPTRGKAKKAKVGDLNIVNPRSPYVKEKLAILKEVAEAQTDLIEAVHEIEKEGRINLSGTYEIGGNLTMGETRDFDGDHSTIVMMGKEDQTVAASGQRIGNLEMRNCKGVAPSKNDKMNLILDLLRSIIAEG